MAMISTIPALMAMLKIIGEEKKNRTEQLLGLAVSRTRLLGSSFVVSIVVAFVMLSLTAIGMWSASTAVMDDGIDFRYSLWCSNRLSASNVDHDWNRGAAWRYCTEINGPNLDILALFIHSRLFRRVTSIPGMAR